MTQWITCEIMVVELEVVQSNRRQKKEKCPIRTEAKATLFFALLILLLSPNPIAPDFRFCLDPLFDG